MNPLYDLPSDPDEAVAALRRHHGRRSTTDEELHKLVLKDVSDLLADEAVAPDVRQRIRDVYSYLARDATSAPVRGPLGLYMFLSSASEAALLTSNAAGLVEQARAFFADDVVRVTLREYYSISARFDLTTASLHKIGTTSVILSCRETLVDQAGVPPEIALKCLLPRYLSVNAIRDRTESYQADNQLNTRVVPWVYESTERWIALEFVEGDTLEERLTQRAPGRPTGSGIAADERYAALRALDREDIEFVREMSLAVVAALDELAKRGRRHGDLSPSNIIIVSQRGEPLRVKLIDLGESYAIAERVGSSAAIARASLYVAPELMRDRKIVDWRCDLYSLGVIILAATAKRTIGREDIHAELDRLWAGEAPWDGAPGYARIVEDLIDEQPHNRLLLWSAETHPRPYEYLGKLVEQESQVLELYEVNTESTGFGLLRGWGLVRFWSNEQLKNLFQAPGRIKSPVDDEYEQFPVLARWASASVALWTFTLAAFVILTLADLKFQLTYGWIKQLAVPAQFHVGRFWHNLPGRLVSLSFALTAVTYYVNNFSTLAPGRLGSRLTRASDAAMRATAVGLYVPILWAMLYAPQAWPLCSGIGTLLVVANNYLALRVAQRGEDVGDRFTTPGNGGKRFLREIFKEWWSLMLIYSSSMILIGVLLLRHVAHDAGIFAALVVTANVLKMYRLNCVRFAPQVRGYLAREILTLRRSARLPPKTGAEPEDADLPRTELVAA